MYNLPEMPSGYRLKQGYDDFTISDRDGVLVLIYKTGYGGLWWVEWLDGRKKNQRYGSHVEALHAAAQELSSHPEE